MGENKTKIKNNIFPRRRDLSRFVLCVINLCLKNYLRYLCNVVRLPFYQLKKYSIRKII